MKNWKWIQPASLFCVVDSVSSFSPVGNTSQFLRIKKTTQKMTTLSITFWKVFFFSQNHFILTRHNPFLSWAVSDGTINTCLNISHFLQSIAFREIFVEFHSIMMTVFLFFKHFFLNFNWEQPLTVYRRNTVIPK